MNTFKTGWLVLALLLIGFFALEPLGVPVSLVAAVGALILLAVAKKDMPSIREKCYVVHLGKLLFFIRDVSGGLWSA